MPTKKTGNPVGRPARIPYSDELADEICSRMINGRHLASICDDPDMPGRYNVYRWMDARPEFANKIRIAREILGDHYVGLMLDAVDNLSQKEDVSVVSLKMRAWMWAAAKYAPRVYSDQVVAKIHLAQAEAQNNNTRTAPSLSHMTLEEKVELKRLLEKARSPVELVEGY